MDRNGVISYKQVVRIVFIAAAVFLVGNSVLRTPRHAAVGVALLAIGLPVYAFFRRRRRG